MGCCQKKQAKFVCDMSASVDINITRRMKKKKKQCADNSTSMY